LEKPHPTWIDKRRPAFGASQNAEGLDGDCLISPFA
jgi:hypothetical protein